MNEVLNCLSNLINLTQDNLKSVKQKGKSTKHASSCNLPSTRSVKVTRISEKNLEFYLNKAAIIIKSLRECFKSFLGIFKAFFTSLYWYG